MNPYREAPAYTTVDHGKFYWSREPGKFLNKNTGQALSFASSLSIGPQFTGTTLEWYETLVETLIDAGNRIKRECMLFPDVAITNNKDLMCILEPTVLYKPHDEKEYCGKLAYGIQAEYVGDGKPPTNIFELSAYDESTKTKHVMLVEVLDMV